ncbi:MAG: hypothetical protein PHV34_19645 [Verrucomicrobiae bacterium]|nr:hypothetical protein [Verrucomicrobiae bacterium]
MTKDKIRSEIRTIKESELAGEIGHILFAAGFRRASRSENGMSQIADCHAGIDRHQPCHPPFRPRSTHPVKRPSCETIFVSAAFLMITKPNRSAFQFSVVIPTIGIYLIILTAILFRLKRLNFDVLEARFVVLAVSAFIAQACVSTMKRCHGRTRWIILLGGMILLLLFHQWISHISTKCTRSFIDTAVISAALYVLIIQLIVRKPLDDSLIRQG